VLLLSAPEDAVTDVCCRKKALTGVRVSAGKDTFTDVRVSASGTYDERIFASGKGISRRF
jgi:hypothetical protein